MGFLYSSLCSFFYNFLLECFKSRYIGSCISTKHSGACNQNICACINYFLCIRQLYATIDLYIHLQALIHTVLVQLLCGVLLAQIGIERCGGHVVGFSQLLGDLNLFLLLVADQQKIGVVVACQGGGVLQAYT